MLKAKTTFNKTVCLPEPLYQRFILWQALAPQRRSFNGTVVAWLDEVLPPLKGSQTPSSPISEPREGQP